MSHFLKITLFSLSLFGWIQASDDKTGRDKSYEKYFKQQEQIHQDLLGIPIPGVCRLGMDEILAEKVLENSSQEIKNAISRIEQNIFDTNQKNIMLHGFSGTGKSSLAKAIAIKTKTPCLFFNVGSISTQYINSGVQNMNNIFEYAKGLERRLGKPCVIIFDELEALTRKHASKDNHENTILMNFWQQLDSLADSKVFVISSMNKIEDLPSQVTTRSLLVEVPLPDFKQRESSLSYYCKAKQNKYGIIYSEFVTPAIIAAQTNGFSNRDLKNLVDRASEEAILASSLLDRSHKMVMSYEFDKVIKQIKKDPKRKLERELGTWKHSFKTHFRDPKAIFPAAALITMMYYGQKNLSNAERGFGYTEKGLAMQEKGINQSKEQFEYQTGWEHMGKQALYNLPGTIIGAVLGKWL